MLSISGTNIADSICLVDLNAIPYTDLITCKVAEIPPDAKHSTSYEN